MAKNYKKRTAEEIRQETNELTQQALESVEKYTRSPESMKELMDFMSKFPERSFRNQVLIQQQFPGAQACLGRAALNKHKIFIKKGEVGNKIFVRKTVKGFYDKKRGFVRESYATKEDQAKIEKGEIKIEKKPYYTIEKVFDISQTQLKPEDYPKIFPNRVFNFELDEKGRNELKQGISAIAKELNIQIKDMREGELYRGELGSAKGAYVHDPITNQEEIVLNSRNTETHNLSTSIHELAHAKLHKQSDIPLPIKELQAEMTSYIVNKHFGMDTSEKAIPYIASWTNNGAALNTMEPTERGKILNDVSRVANQFIQTISAEINQQREMERDRNVEYSSLEKKSERVKSSENSQEKNWYELELRPASIGTHPNTAENPAMIDKDYVNSKGRKYGAVGYEQKLSETDRMNYDLGYIGSGRTAQEAQLDGSMRQSLEVGQILYRTVKTPENKINQVARVTSIDEHGVHIDWVERINGKGAFQKNAQSSLEAYSQESMLNEWQLGSKTHENIFNKATNEEQRLDESKDIASKNLKAPDNLKNEVIPIKDSVFVDKMTGKVSHGDTGRCLSLKDGMYIKKQDHVELSGKIYNQEVSTTLSKDHFFSGYPFRFPKEQIAEIQSDHERKSRVMAGQQKQLERA